MRVQSMQGDTLDLLCHRHLGRTAGVTEAALSANPGLAALGPVLPIGTDVDLPEISSGPATQTDSFIQLWD